MYVIYFNWWTDIVRLDRCDTLISSQINSQEICILLLNPSSLDVVKSSIHTEKSFIIESNRNKIVFTIFRLLWNQTDFRLVPNQSDNDKNYNISFNNIFEKIYLCAAALWFLLNAPISRGHELNLVKCDTSNIFGLWLCSIFDNLDPWFSKG